MDQTTAKLLVAWRDLAIARGQCLACHRLVRSHRGRLEGDVSLVERLASSKSRIEDASNRLVELGEHPDGGES